MSATTDTARAREIAPTCENSILPSGCGSSQRKCGPCVLAHAITAALAAVRAEERDALAAEFERKADAVPIAQTIDFNGFAQSEFNLLMWAARAIRRQEG